MPNPQINVRVDKKLRAAINELRRRAVDPIPSEAEINLHVVFK